MCGADRSPEVRRSRSRIGTRTAADRGAAIVLAIMLTALLSTIGAALVLLTTTEVAIAGNFHTATEALYAADAVIEQVRQDLRAMPDWSSALDGSGHSTFMDGPPSGARTFVGGAVDLDTIVNHANCHRASPCTTADFDRVTSERPWGTDNPRWRVFAAGTLAALLGSSSADAGLYVVALVGDDGAENDGAPERDGQSLGAVPNPGNGVLELRAIAFGSGGAQRAVQVTLARDVGAAAIPSDVRILAWREVW